MTKRVASEFSATSVYSFTIPLLRRNRAVRGWPTSTCRYFHTEITNLLSRAHARQGAGNETILIQYHAMWIKISEQFFVAWACLTYIATMCTKLRTICNYCFQRGFVVITEVLFALELQNIWDVGPKNGLRSDLRASNLTKFTWESITPDPRDTM